MTHIQLSVGGESIQIGLTLAKYSKNKPTPDQETFDAGVN
jgi:hypothetical protein